MSSEVVAKARVALFKEIDKTDALMESGDYQAAEYNLAKVDELYYELAAMVDINNPVHKTIIQRSRVRIDALSQGIENGLQRREAGKREDGNIAFKCNWSDVGYKGICSDQVYNINKRTPKSQCSRSNCREYVGKPPPKNDCCYECEALRKFSFGAGWNHDDSGKPLRARHIWHARKGKIALLTTIPHRESARLVVGAYQINDVEDDPHRETFIHGEENTALDDMLDFSIRFWRFHKNPGKPESQAWGQGLFRYVSDIAVFGILEEYINRKGSNGGDITRAKVLIGVLKGQGSK
jgi:hypothetical protein